MWSWLLVACGPKAPSEALEPAPTAVPAPSGELTQAQKNLADWAALSAFVRERYCCWSERATDWARVDATYQPRAEAAPNELELFKVLEDALDELYDPTTQLANHLASSWRRSSYDMWGDVRDGVPVIVAVQPGSDAQTQGLRSGDVLLEVGLDDVATAMAQRRPECLREPSDEAEDWTLRSLLAGRYNRVREFRVKRTDGGTTFSTIKQTKRELPPSVRGEMLSGGLVVLEMSRFDGPEALASFDAAMDQLREAKGLMVDLRDNPGGDLQVAHQMLGRFLATPLSYGTLEGPLTVEPRGAWAFTAPVVVLVDHWTEGAAEHLALGLRATGHAYLVGTTMGGLAASTATLSLPHSGYEVVVATALLRDRTGVSSGRVLPDVGVDLSVKPYGDPIRDAGLAKLKALVGATP